MANINKATANTKAIKLPRWPEVWKELNAYCLGQRGRAEYIAAEIGISPSKMSRIRNGTMQPNANEAFAIVEYLLNEGVTI